MSLFDQLVDQALKNQLELSPLRAVVEKELLHHDIIREMKNEFFVTPVKQPRRRSLRASVVEVRASRPHASVRYGIR